MPNIYYNGKLMETTDGRFNKKQTQFGSDPRINKRKKKYVHIRIRPKLIFYTIVILFILSKMVHVDMGFIDHSQAVQAPVTKVMAKDEQVATPQPQVQNKPTSTDEIKSKIRNVFGKDADNAIKLVSQCENRAMNPNQIGDDYPINGKHIVSVGVFQIRALPGRPSIEELKNVDVNIAEAYKIFKRDGRFGATSGWYNCSQILNIP